MSPWESAWRAVEVSVPGGGGGGGVSQDVVLNRMPVFSV